MAQLRRNQFAYLFERLLDEYEKVLKVAGLEVSKTATQNAILGIGPNLKDFRDNQITTSSNSISHVVYYTLCRKNPGGEVEGFPERSNRYGGLLFQGGLLLKAFGMYNTDAEEIDLSDTYLNAYLNFIGISLEKLKEKSDDKSYQAPERLKIFHTLQKPRKGGTKKLKDNYSSKFKFDIFLASPKLTLGRKIDYHYQNFENSIRDEIGGEISDELREALIRHFFGFLPRYLNQEYETFEKYIEGLRVKLQSMGFEVYDSRQGLSSKDVRNFGKAGEQLKKDKKIIEKSRTYVLVAPYPRLFTSAWLEAGIALGSDRPCIFICKDRTDDLPWVLQNDSKELGVETIEIRDLFNLSIEDRIELTAFRITRTNAFHCVECALEDGLDGFIGKDKCPECKGKGYHTLKSKLAEYL